jgi:hypothetical protein
MKIIATLFASILLAFTLNSGVFICDSKTSKVYHSTKTCRGIKNCSHEIKEVTLKEATGTYSRVACKICYK